MKAENIKEYLNKLKKFNEWELEQRKNYDPELSIQKFFALYKFGMEIFSPKSIENHHQKHLEHLIKIQKIFNNLT